MENVTPVDAALEVLARAAASGRLVVFFGAGVSRDAGFPSWDGLLNGLAELAVAKVPGFSADHLKDFHKNPLPLPVQASVLRDALGPGRLQAEIVRRFAPPDAEPTRLHRTLAAIPGAIFLTTNYDLLMEAALRGAGLSSARSLCVDDTAALQGLRSGDVVHIHGSIDRPTTIVLAGEDYQHVTHGVAPAWQEVLKASLVAGEVLLVGYGFADPNIQAVVGAVRAAFNNDLRGPYWLEQTQFNNEHALAAQSRIHGLRRIDVATIDDRDALLERLVRRATELRRRPTWNANLSDAGHLGQIADDRLRELLTEARANLHGDRALGLRRATEAVAHAVALAAECPDAAASREFLARARLELALHHAVGHAPGAGRELLSTVEVEALPPADRGTLAQLLIQDGDLEPARAALHGLKTGSEDVQLQAAFQLLALAEGEPPAPPFARDYVGARVGLELYFRGEAARPAAYALDILAPAAKASIPARFEALQLLHFCLLRSLLRAESEDVIPVERRAEAISALESGLRALCEPNEDHAIRTRRAAAELLQQHTAWALDPDLRALAARVLLTTDESEDPEWTPFPESAMPGSEALVAAINAAGSALRELRTNEALALADAGLARWPGRAHFIGIRATARGALGDGAGALEDAREAFRLAPAMGNRVLLSQCLLADGRPIEAWETLRVVTGSSTRELLRLQCDAAAAAAPAEAVGHWRNYLERFPEDREARAGFAQLLRHLGLRAEAVVEARLSFQGAEPEALSPRALNAIAVTLLQPGASQSDRAQVRSIAQRLITNNASSPTAQAWAMELYERLGAPADLPRPDLRVILESGSFQAISREDFVERLGHEQLRANEIRSLYGAGKLSAENTCDLLRHPIAGFAFDAVPDDDGWQAPGAPFMCPVRLGGVPETDGVSTFLVGPLELCLGARLGLLRAFDEASRRGHRFALFRDAHGRILAEADDAERAASTESKQRLERARNTLWALPASTRVQNASAAMVDPVSDDPATAARFAAWLNAIRGAGGVPAEALGELDTHPDAGTWPPGLVVLEFPALQLLAERELMETVIRATVRLGGSVAISEDCERELAAALAHRERLAGIARTADEVRRWVVRAQYDDFLALIDRPSPFAGLLPRELLDLPILRAWDRALAPRAAVLARPGWVQLSADAHEASPLESDSLGLLRGHWRANADEIRAFLASVSEAAAGPRLWTLVEFADEFEAPGYRIESRRRLALLGHPNALSGEVWARVFQIGGGANGLLARDFAATVIRPCHRSDRVSAPVSRWLLGGAIADYLWQRTRRADVSEEGEFFPVEAAPASAEPVSDVFALVSNVPGVSAAVVEHLVLQSLGGPMAFVEATHETAFTFSDASPGGRMWADVVASIGATDSAALEVGIASGIASAYTVLGRAFPDHARAILDILFRAATGRNPTSAFASLSVRALLILGPAWQDDAVHEALTFPRWQTPGSTVFSAEDIVQAAATWVADDGDRLATLLVEPFRFAVPPESTRADPRPAWIPATVPIEAVLLRVDPGHLERLRDTYFGASRAVDGRLVAAAQAFFADPTAMGARVAFAEAAAFSPGAALLRAPEAIERFGRALQSHHLMPEFKRDLLALLDEPERLELASIDTKGFLREIQARLTPGGAWNESPWLWSIARQVRTVPGQLGAFLLPSILSAAPEHLEAAVVGAIHSLENPSHAPVGHLGASIWLLRCAVDRLETVQLGGRSVSLAEFVPDLFARLLTALQGEPAPGSIGAHEADILRLCAALVARFEGPESTPQALWLTWRLYGWLTDLIVTAPDRPRLLNALAAFVPAAVDRHGADIRTPDALDPTAWHAREGHWNHRLATVLFALSLADAFALQTLGEAPARPPRIITGRALEAGLLDLAQRPVTDLEHSLALAGRPDDPSFLGFNGPTAIADLALWALLSRDVRRVLAVSPEVRREYLIRLRSTVGQNARPALHSGLRGALLRALGFAFDGLDAAEQAALSATLAQDLALDLDFLWIGLGALRSGLASAREPVALAISRISEHDDFVRTAIQYLPALPATDLLEAWDRLCEHLRRLGGAGFALVPGLVHVYMRGAEHLAVANALFDRLAADPAFRDHPEWPILMSRLGRGESTTPTSDAE